MERRYGSQENKQEKWKSKPVTWHLIVVWLSIEKKRRDLHFATLGLLIIRVFLGFRAGWGRKDHLLMLQCNLLFYSPVYSLFSVIVFLTDLRRLNESASGYFMGENFEVFKKNQSNVIRLRFFTNLLHTMFLEYALGPLFSLKGDRSGFSFLS